MSSKEKFKEGFILITGALGILKRFKETYNLTEI